jgi:hypothetical protein
MSCSGSVAMAGDPAAVEDLAAAAESFQEMRQALSALVSEAEPELGTRSREQPLPPVL